MTIENPPALFNTLEILVLLLFTPYTLEMVVSVSTRMDMVISSHVETNFFLRMLSFVLLAPALVEVASALEATQPSASFSFLSNISSSQS